MYLLQYVRTFSKTAHQKLPDLLVIGFLFLYQVESGNMSVAKGPEVHVERSR